MEEVVQALIRSEAEEHFGAPWNAKGLPRPNGYRNGLKDRELRTRMGTLKLSLPQARNGSFFPSCLERWQTSEQALAATLGEMVIKGVSTRKVARLAEEMLGVEVSACTVSNLLKAIEPKVDAFRGGGIFSNPSPFLIPWFSNTQHHPSLGGETMKAAKKAEAWLCGSAMMVLVVGILGCGKDKASNPPAALAQEAAFSVSPSEKAIMCYLAGQDFANWAWTGKMANIVNPVDAPKTIRVDANTIQNEYSANEVAADLKYRDKYMLVIGVVSSIDRSVGATYYLRLKGGRNPFNAVHAKMANDDVTLNYLAGLKKGQEVLIYGKCEGMLMKSVTLTECGPLGFWGRAYSKEYVQKYLEVLPAFIKANDSNDLKLAIEATKYSSLFISPNPFEKQPIDSNDSEKITECNNIALAILGVCQQSEEGLKKTYKIMKVSSRSDLLTSFLHELKKDPDWKEARAYLVPSLLVKDSNGVETTVWDLACRKYGPLAKSVSPVKDGH